MRLFIKRKRIMVFLMVMFFLVPALAYSQEISLPNITGGEGETITVPVMMNNAVNQVTSFGVQVVYDNSRLTFQGSSITGTLVENFNNASANEAVAGTVILGGYDTTGLAAGSNGVLMNLSFTVNTGACASQTSSPFTLQNPVDDISTWQMTAGSFSCTVSGVCTSGETQACSTGLLGICASGTETCDGTGNWGACVQDNQPAAETCDGLDNNCDGSIDEGCSVSGITTSIDNPNPYPGESICIDVDIAGANDVYAISFDMIYDSLVLNYQSAAEGNFLNQDGQTTVFLTELLNGIEGQVVTGISRFGNVGGVSGSGNLAQYCFQVVGNYGDNTTITFSDARMEGPIQGSDIPITLEPIPPVPVVPAPPSGLAASDPGTRDRIDLNWTASSGADQYDVHRSDSSGGTFAVIGTSSGTSYQDSNCILPTLNYYYQVVAKLGSYASDPSVEVPAVVKVHPVFAYFHPSN